MFICLFSKTQAYSKSRRNWLVGQRSYTMAECGLLQCLTVLENTWRAHYETEFWTGEKAPSVKVLAQGSIPRTHVFVLF